MKRSEKEIIQHFFSIAKTISSILDVDTLLRHIGEVAEQLTDSEASSIMLLDDDKMNLYFKVATGEKGNVIKKLKIRVGQGIAGSVAQTKQSLTINDVSKDSRFNISFDKSSGFITKSILAVPITLGDELIGVAEVLNKKGGEDFTEEDRAILEGLASLASVSIGNAKLAEDQKNFFVYIIEIIVQAIEGRDPKRTGHTWRVAQISTAIGKSLGLEGQDYKDLYYGALLHDIGYLTATGPGSSEDIFSFIQKSDEKMNPTRGWEMVRKINILRGAAPLVLYHQEHYDGSGYPEGLKGDGIPLGAQIIAFAEFLDELKMQGYTPDKITEMAREESGKKLNPKIVDTYLQEMAATS
ncbi:MAG: GAF domain-containing protein [Elusimicrobia bacterium]|nr:GAF domain-containing protein [Elusimicrobiota bacterium]